MKQSRLVTISIVVLSLSTGFLVSPSQADQNLCPDYVLVGARGSSEKTPHQLPSNAGVYIDPNSLSEIGNYKAWLGQTIASLFANLVRKDGPFVSFNPENTNQNIPGKTSLAWLSYGVFPGKTLYPAAKVPTSFNNRKETRDYLGEVTTENLGFLKTSLREYSGRCPNSKFFLVGYSQGATIIRLAVSKLSPAIDSDVIQKIAGVVLIADPLLSPKDLRLAVNKDARWTGTVASCGALRLLATISPECYFSPESAFLNLLGKSLEGYYMLYECVKKQGCENSWAVDVNLAKLVKPAFTTAEIFKNTGVKEIISVCYVGDLVCSPFGKVSNLPWEYPSKNKPGEIHTDFYKETSTSYAIAQWIEKRVPQKTVTSPTTGAGKLIVEEWFGKGWIGSDASCVNILKIANTANKAQLKDWNTWKDMRVIALNPSTGTLLTVTTSPGSGDPYTFISGNSKSTKGRWMGFEDFWEMFDASSKHWASYGLSYKNNKFTCKKW